MGDFLYCLLHSRLKLYFTICVTIYDRELKVYSNFKQLYFCFNQSPVLNCPLSGRHTSDGSDPAAAWLNEAFLALSK